MADVELDLNIASICKENTKLSFHYENLPMQYTEIFSPVKIEISSEKF